MIQYLFLLSTLLSFNNEIYWDDDYLEIELYEDINLYVNIPKAFINVDGVIYEADYYQKGVNYTSLSVVNSNHPKKHLVYYKAYFNEFNKTSTNGITFDIKDNEAPYIVEVPSFRVPLNQKVDDLTKGIIVKDNYDDSKDISISVNTSQIVTNRVGIYEIVFSVKDSSNNLSNYYSTYEVFDHLAPEIQIYNPLEHSVYTSFDYNKYFKFKDNYDTYLDVYIDTSKVNFNQLGIYEMVVSVSDKSLNSTSMLVNISIVDDKPPDLILTPNPEPILVNTKITHELLKSYLVSINDNYDILSLDDVLISHDINSSYIGKYSINYQISDNSNNITTKSIKVDVKDTKAPNVKVIKDLKISVGSNYFDYNDYFLISDNYDEIDVLTISINEKINLTKIGYYSIIIKVSDQSKNTYTNTYQLQVVDEIAPYIRVLEDLIFSINDKVDYSKYLELTDNYDSELLLKVDDSNVDYNQPGKYNVLLTLSDKSNNTYTINEIITIIDIIPPALILEKTNLYVSSLIDSKAIYDLIIDYYDDSTPKDLINIFIDFEMKISLDKQTFIAKITLIDLSFNQRVESIYVHYRKSNDDYYFYTTNINYNIGDEVIDFKGIDTNIDKRKLVINNSGFDVNQSGVYQIKYYYINTYGIIEEYEQIITVKGDANLKLYDYKYFLLTTTLIIGVIIYLIYNRNKKDKKHEYL